MPAPETLLVFAIVSLGFVALPGPSSMFVLGRGLGFGPRAAVAGAVGCATGAMAYVVATAVGLSAVLASSTVAFRAVHYAGAAYLILLGVRALRSGGPRLPAAQAQGPSRLWPSYWQGLLVELTNPKVALFFLALFPQFIHAGHGPVWLQVIVLGCLFVPIGLLSDSTYAVASGKLGEWLARRPAFLRRQGSLTGVLYLGLGVWAAASGSGPERR